MKTQALYVAVSVNLPMKPIEQTLAVTVAKLGLEKPDFVVEQLGLRWHGGKVVLHPAGATLQTREVPLETLFPQNRDFVLRKKLTQSFEKLLMELHS